MRPALKNIYTKIKQYQWIQTHQSVQDIPGPRKDQSLQKQQQRAERLRHLNEGEVVKIYRAPVLQQEVRQKLRWYSDCFRKKSRRISTTNQPTLPQPSFTNPRNKRQCFIIGRHRKMLAASWNMQSRNMKHQPTKRLG